ncbi:MAG: response regulator [Clostridium sp.]
MYHVIIIEDDPMVAAINKQYIEVDPEFQVLKIFKSGIDALEYLKTGSVHLIILDFYTPLMNGSEFLDALHGMGQSPSVIMVTSANDADIVTGLLSRGIIDYLVKPFEYSRFKMALDKFQQTQKLLDTVKSNMKQEDIDRLFLASEQSISASSHLAKGLNDVTLNLIRGFLKDNFNSMYTSEQVAEQVHLSRITIRRYMNYMADTGEIVSTIDYQTGGRPSIMYRYAKTE